MNKTRLYATIFLSAMLLCSMAQITPISQMEKLDRGLVALPANSGNGIFVSWRFLGTDDNNTRFDLIRNGTTIATDLEVSNFKDDSGNSSSEYQVITKVNGETISTSAPVKAWGEIYKKLKLDRPATGAQGGTYSPNDCSVGDVDGDGEYEIFVKWDPSNSQDNSNGGKTDNVYLDCYKLDGTKLWRIDLGVNIRAGAHYTQFQVYDYDGDGKAELMCKTAPGSKDGKGNYVNQAATDDKIKAANNAKDWRSSAGRINGGHEYLTVFNGETGEAIHTIAYYPTRNAKAELSEAAGTYNWDDRDGKNDKGDYGNRGERYLAATAYLDGPDHNPSGIFCRGYYTYAHIWAVDFDGQQLKTRWLHSSDARTTYKLRDADGNSRTYKGNTCFSGLKRYTMYANGNHNMSIADVDGDGKDEIIWGSAALDDDGKMLYSVGFGHGDAIHLADLDPDRPGLELFDVHEEKGDYAWDIHDAATGEIIWKGGPKGADNGRGLAADIVASNRGYEFWSSYGGAENATDRNQNPFSAQTAAQVISKKGSMNFRIYWDGDLQDELFDGTNISNWDGSSFVTTALGNYNASSSCNGTKATPNLLADLFGDWREEVILWSANDNATLNIFTTNIPTTYRVPTLMHDHTYRMGICWQNTAYNQPPHLGYYLPDYIDGKLTGIESIKTNTQTEESVIYDLSGRRLPTSDLNILPKGIYIIKQGTIIIKFNKQ
ncbi:MAG: rhamnogalacturonan lyase [Prevotella sp.]|nr:rhamnogalacturonan lyase [Prevotella sp.]